MKSPLPNKKGAVEELAVFTVAKFVIGFGLILTIILSKIYGIGTSLEYEKNLFAKDLALAIDAGHAVRADVNYALTYQASPLGIEILPRKVTVFQEDVSDGHEFWFNEDPSYDYVYGAFKPGRPEPALTLFRKGRRLGVLPANIKQNLLAPVCDTFSGRKIDAQVNYQSIPTIGSETVELVTRGALVTVSAKTGNPIIKTYVNNHPASGTMACSIVAELASRIPDLKGFSIIPVQSALLAKDDARYTIARSSGPAVHIDISLPSIEATQRSDIGTSIESGVENFVV